MLHKCENLHKKFLTIYYYQSWSIFDWLMTKNFGLKINRKSENPQLLQFLQLEADLQTEEIHLKFSRLISKRNPLTPNAICYYLVIGKG